MTDLIPIRRAVGHFRPKSTSRYDGCIALVYHTSCHCALRPSNGAYSLRSICDIIEGDCVSCGGEATRTPVSVACYLSKRWNFFIHDGYVFAFTKRGAPRRHLYPSMADAIAWTKSRARCVYFWVSDGKLCPLPLYSMPPVPRFNHAVAANFLNPSRNYRNAASLIEDALSGGTGSGKTHTLVSGAVRRSRHNQYEVIFGSPDITSGYSAVVTPEVLGKTAVVRVGRKATEVRLPGRHTFSDVIVQNGEVCVAGSPFKGGHTLRIICICFPTTVPTRASLVGLCAFIRSAFCSEPGAATTVSMDEFHCITVKRYATTVSAVLATLKNTGRPVSIRGASASLIGTFVKNQMAFVRALARVWEASSGKELDERILWHSVAAAIVRLAERGMVDAPGVTVTNETVLVDTPEFNDVTACLDEHLRTLHDLVARERVRGVIPVDRIRDLISAGYGRAAARVISAFYRTGLSAVGNAEKAVSSPVSHFSDLTIKTAYVLPSCSFCMDDSGGASIWLGCGHAAICAECTEDIVSGEIPQNAVWNCCVCRNGSTLARLPSDAARLAENAQATVRLPIRREAPKSSSVPYILIEGCDTASTMTVVHPTGGTPKRPQMDPEQEDSFTEPCSDLAGPATPSETQSTPAGLDDVVQRTKTVARKFAEALATEVIRHADPALRTGVVAPTEVIDALRSRNLGKSWRFIPGGRRGLEKLTDEKHQWQEGGVLVLPPRSACISTGQNLPADIVIRVSDPVLTKVQRTQVTGRFVRYGGGEVRIVDISGSNV